MPTVTLLTQDNKELTVDTEVAIVSNVLKGSMDVGSNKSGNIELKKIKLKQLRKVMEWAKQHKDDPPAEDLDGVELDCTISSDWDKEFLKIDQKSLYDIMLAANFLDVRSLLYASCKTIASYIKGKTVEEIRSFFNLKSNFTKAEEDAIKHENSWHRSFNS